MPQLILKRTRVIDLMILVERFTLLFIFRGATTNCRSAGTHIIHTINSTLAYQLNHLHMHYSILVSKPNLTFISQAIEVFVWYLRECKWVQRRPQGG